MCLLEDVWHMYTYLFMWMTVVVTVMPTHRAAETKQQQPQIFIYRRISLYIYSV
jgi:hypothetical protein